MALTDKLSAIADAIRGKTGKTDGLTLEQMPGEIAGIQSGGDASIADGLVDRTLTSYSSDNLTMVGNYAFTSCVGLTNVSLPNISKVGDYAFHGCTSLTNVSLPNVTTLPGHVFENSGLRTFFFPNLTSGGSSCLQNTKIESITTEDLPSLKSWGGNYCFGGISTLKYFRHTLAVIMNTRTFQGCGALEKVDTHTVGLTYHALSGCSSLNTLILRRTDAICELGNTNALTNTPIIKGTGFVYTPRALIEEYRQATNWSSLLPEQFRAIEDYPEICEVGV